MAIRIPGPGDPFGPPRRGPEERAEDLGPDAFGNRGLSRAGLEEAGRRVAARFAAPEAALRRAQALIFAVVVRCRIASVFTRLRNTTSSNNPRALLTSSANE